MKAHRSRKRILVADESISTQKLLYTTLASPEAEVINASDGQDAWGKIRSLKPDVVFLDLHLRGHSTEQIMSDLAAEGLSDGLKVFVLYATDTTPPLPDWVSGAMRKPLDPKQLKALVEGDAQTPEDVRVSRLKERLNEAMQEEPLGTPPEPTKVEQAFSADLDRLRADFQSSLQQLKAEVRADLIEELRVELERTLREDFKKQFSERTEAWLKEEFEKISRW